MSSHTPGPWEILTYDWGDKFGGVKPFIDPFGNYVIQSKTEEPFIAFVNWFANARLIAAAPEMKELLEGELYREEAGVLSWEREAKIRAILKRIEGEEV